ncbi:MAG TPA: hypothetical protein VHM89_11395 [Acidimicrobiales bacterium]|nr:hypothetical protein [Acidimicrobiales bacterium]
MEERRSTAAAADPTWERRHPGGPESWSFDFVAPGGGVAGFVGLTIWSAPRRAWYWAALVGRRRPYLLVRDLEVAAPRAPTSREIRADGLWADLNCETPHDHWSVGLEAFGVLLDDPDEALGGERGERTGLGLDLEWEAAAPVVGGVGSYGQACSVHGEILVGGGGGPVETITFDGRGWRRHAWGKAVGWFTPASRLDGHLEDGRPFTATGLVPPAIDVLCRAPLRLELSSRRSVLERALCRFRTPEGSSGLAWSEHVVAPAPGPAAG